jgi:hypothetical protein
MASWLICRNKDASAHRRQPGWLLQRLAEGSGERFASDLQATCKLLASHLQATCKLTQLQVYAACKCLPLADAWRLDANVSRELAGARWKSHFMVDAEPDI